MAGVLVVAGVGMMRCVLGGVLLKSPHRSGRRMDGVRMLRVRVSHRRRSVAMRRLAMFRCNTRAGRHWFGVIVNLPPPIPAPGCGAVGCRPAGIEDCGAFIMGRNMFGPGRDGWAESWRGRVSPSVTHIRYRLTY